MKHVFVGDIHGKLSAVKAALDKDGRKIFVGDIIDSSRGPEEEYAACYDLILAAIAKDEAAACFGNHELSYLLPEKHRCSRYTPWNADIIKTYTPALLAAFQPFILLRPDFLVSHAGLTWQIWQTEKLFETSLKNRLDAWWLDVSSPMHWIGRARGGPDDIGGMFWCDYHEEFMPVKELTQVFGHSRLPGGVVRESNHFAVDCLDFKQEFLELDI